MHSLFPAIKPYKTHELAVREPHVLYLEETGSPSGIPVIVLHPGPGAGDNTQLRRFFDPEKYRIIIFDQRGCGRSTPHAELRHNSSQELLDDIDAIQHYFKLNRFVLFGVGWGSLLALLYAERYPQQISALLLSQIYLGRKQDSDWFYKQGANQIYPDHWQEFIRLVPEDLRQSIPEFYNQLLQGPNELARMSAAKNWVLWQAHCSSLQPHQHLLDQFSDPHFALSLASIESHYLINHYFIEENQVLNNAHKIRHIPSYLVHGRYDIVTPMGGAYLLNEVLPASNLSIVRDAGHSLYEPGIIDAIIQNSQEILRTELNVG